jgi:hypothetical protein
MKKTSTTLSRNDHETERNGYTTWTNEHGYYVQAITEGTNDSIALSAPQRWTHYAVRTPNGLVFNFRRYDEDEHVNTVRARAFRFVETGCKYGPTAIERYGDWRGWDRVKATGHSTLEVDGKPMVIGSVTEIICPVYPSEDGGVIHADCRSTNEGNR